MNSGDVARYGPGSCVRGCSILYHAPLREDREVQITVSHNEGSRPHPLVVHTAASWLRRDMRLKIRNRVTIVLTQVLCVAVAVKM